MEHHQTQPFKENVTYVSKCDTNVNWQVVSLTNKTFYNIFTAEKIKERAEKRRKMDGWRKGWKVNSPHMWWWRGPWRHCSTTGNTVLLMAVQQKPGAPTYKHTHTHVVSAPKRTCHCVFMLTCEHMFMFADICGMRLSWVSYRVLLLFMQRESGAQRHVGLGMERSDWDGWIRPPRSTNRRLRKREEPGKRS